MIMNNSTKDRQYLFRTPLPCLTKGQPACCERQSSITDTRWESFPAESERQTPLAGVAAQMFNFRKIKGSFVVDRRKESLIHKSPGHTSYGRPQGKLCSNRHGNP